LNELLLEALYLPAEKRLLRRLVELAALYDGGEDKITISLTQEAIAELAGVGRATVNQLLREEEKRGTIALERGRTRVLDLDELGRRAR
jgi:CRP-like cAMP-binding protein